MLEQFFGEQKQRSVEPTAQADEPDDPDLLEIQETHIGLANGKLKAVSFCSFPCYFFHVFAILCVLLMLFANHSFFVGESNILTISDVRLKKTLLLFVQL